MEYNSGMEDIAILENDEIAPAGYTYEQYKSLGGKINRYDYQSALDRIQGANISNKTSILQAESMAKNAGIILHNTESNIDPRIILYGILCTDKKLAKDQNHNGQKGDQYIFAEALRILEDTDALSKLIETYHKAGIHCPICSNVPGEECR